MRFWLTLRHEGIRAALWSLLPDNCEVRSLPLQAWRGMPRYWFCPRTGVRGNENRITWPDGKVRVMCDDCSSAFSRMFGHVSFYEGRESDE